ncbi:MAG: N-6 DNA methylase [Planctomycetes bacterium]|nr:N-6 DNA methylase [Planctomycetota bacterium]
MSKPAPEIHTDKLPDQVGEHLADYVSGRSFRATPEEVEAVQVFSRRLVEELGYPKEVIQTRPQFRVRMRPSDVVTRGYPIDIAVFRSEKKLEDDVYIVVECKRKSRVDGEKQLKLYLQMCSAPIGVWFNGEDHLYLHKRLLRDGSVEWITLPTLPRRDQDLADIGSVTREQLVPPANLKSVFRDIRNHLAGNTVGITTDQRLAQEIMSLLFCKIFDELDAAPTAQMRWRAKVDEPEDKVADRIHALFKSVKAEYPDVFEPDEKITLDSKSLRYVVGELQNYLITVASRDAIGEAFEVFIGPAVRGEEGQFFTPRNVVQLMVGLLDPAPTERVIDPACGSGGFLIVTLEHIWAKLDEEGRAKKWPAARLDSKKRDAATHFIRGLDKDSFLTKVTKAYMAIVGDGRGGIFCEDSLEEPKNWRAGTRASNIALAQFDVVLTNPPFGSKIKVAGAHKLGQYQLARKWKKPKRSSDDWAVSAEFRKDESPQILFIERCTQLLKPGGRLGIVLPESIFGMPKYGYVVKWLLDNFVLRAFVSLPEEVFQPSTHAKTCIVILENRRPPDDYDIEMAIADWCGHDSRGNPTLRVDDAGKEELLDDLPKIAERVHPRLSWRS